MPIHYLNKYWLNSLWPSDVIWRQRSGSALAQVMAWCRQCWLIISKVQWHPSECNFRKNISDINYWNNFEIFLSLNFHLDIPGDTELISVGPLGIHFTKTKYPNLPRLHLKISSVKWQPFCWGLNVLTQYSLVAPSLWCRRVESTLVPVIQFWLPIYKIHRNQGRIQDLKLGVAQMDWKILKGWGWGCGWGCGLQIYQKCDYHSIYIYVYISEIRYISNTLFNTIFFILRPLTYKIL